MKSLKKDFTGQHLGQCTVLGPLPKQPHHYCRFWLLRCDCGNECEKAEVQLKKPSPTMSCKACAARATSRRTRKHGETGTYMFRLWENMNRRCYDQGFRSYRNWGGRGISVCEAWRRDYLAFATWIRANLGERPSPKYSLDRRDNDGNYEPGNVRWATAKMQADNRRGWGLDAPGELIRDMRRWQRETARVSAPPSKRGRPRKPYRDPLI